MRTHLMRHLMIALGVSVCSVPAADAVGADEKAPSRWNSFRQPSTSIQSASKKVSRLPFGASVHAVAAQTLVEELPAPPSNVAGEQMLPAAPTPAAQPAAPMAPSAEAHATEMPYSSPYAAATSAPWDGSAQCGPECSSCAPAAPAVRPIFPWFGGGSLLFWNVSGGDNASLITYDTGETVMRKGDLDPSSEVGYQLHLGRYFACGKYAVDVSYMYWDPDCYCRQVADNGNGLRFINPALTTVLINRGGGPTSVYDDYDTNAVSLQAIRDLRVQSLEVNLHCFGLMGARRLGSCGPGSICGKSCGLFCGKGCHRKFCGSAIGPLARACGGRVRISNSHGFRWFQLEDRFEMGGDVDGNFGYGPDDIYYHSRTENNLYGYQFGSRLSYCLGCRMMINVAGKIGVYGNDASYTHIISNENVGAYTQSQGAGAGDVFSHQSDTSIAGLGELDLGIGYRLSNCWTINGGYRVLSACGVATSVGQMPTEYTSVASAGAVRADDCLTLHGAYLGIDFNW